MRRITFAHGIGSALVAALILSALFAFRPLALAATNTPTVTPTATLTLTPTRTHTPTPTATQSVTYVVQAGDQLLKIARKFGTTVAAIKTANHLPNDTIYIGQILIIPPPALTSTPKATFPPGSNTYVVQPGDQLLKIARAYGVTLAALKAANGLTSDLIVPGQVLLIPTPAPTSPSRTPTAPSTPRTATPTATLSPNSVYYVVQTGDRLTRLAAMYGVTVEAIQKANNLASSTIRVGQTLIIPSPTRHPVGHTVLRGDTLTSIAKLYDTTVDTLKLINRMSNDTIFAGLILIVPSK